MFGRLQFKGVPAADNNEVTDQENSKESNQVVDPASPRIANVQGGCMMVPLELTRLTVVQGH